MSKREPGWDFIEGVFLTAVFVTLSDVSESDANTTVKNAALMILFVFECVQFFRQKRKSTQNFVEYNYSQIGDNPSSHTISGEEFQPESKEDKWMRIYSPLVKAVALPLAFSGGVVGPDTSIHLLFPAFILFALSLGLDSSRAFKGAPVTGGLLFIVGTSSGIAAGFMATKWDRAATGALLAGAGFSFLLTLNSGKQACTKISARYQLN